MEEIDDFEPGWDRSFLWLSSCLAEPYCWGYSTFRYRLVSPLQRSLFGNASHPLLELTRRIATVALAVLVLIPAGTLLLMTATILAPLSITCRAIGVALQRDHFTYVKGKKEEKSDSNNALSLLTWNLRGQAAGEQLKEGGVPSWSSRIDGIVEKIKQDNPDVLILQEIYDTAFAEKLIQKLESEYAHIFCHLGISTFRSSSGLMVFTKCPIATLSYTHFASQAKTPTGFVFLETRGAPHGPANGRIIGTSLPAGNADRKTREEDLKEILSHLKGKTNPLPTFFMGGMNGPIPSFLQEVLHHGDPSENPTQTPSLALQWGNAKATGGKVDLISLFKRKLGSCAQERGVLLNDCHLVEGFVLNDLPHALSDHHGLFAKIELPSGSS